jgi:bifunctional lysine-specific demethylase and histidyl-hydroxylase NO66
MDPPLPRSALGRCTADPDSFLRETWGKRAVVHRGTDPTGFADLLSLDDVDRLLSTTSLRTPTFRLVESGRTIPESAYTRTGRTGSKPVSGMADPARIFERFRRGATIVLQGLHRYHEPLTRFCRELELELGHSCQVNAYVTPAGARGLAQHADPHDVFVLQTFGRKRWELHAAPAEAEREPIDATIASGDCVYLPKGTTHAAWAQDSISGHLTVGVHVATWGNVLGRAWRELEHGALFEDPIDAGWVDRREAFARELGERLATAAVALGALDPGAVADAERDRFLSTRSQLVRGVLRDQLALDEIDDDTPLRRRDDAVCEPRVDGDRLVVLLGDRSLEMPARLEAAVRVVADRSRLRAADLTATLPDPVSRLVLVRRLVREGLLVPEPSLVTEQRSAQERR